MLRSVLLFSTLVALIATECDSEDSWDASQLMQHSVLSSKVSSRKAFEQAVKERSAGDPGSIPLTAAKMGLDAALGMLTQQVKAVNQATTATGSQLNGLMSAAPADEAKAVLQLISSPLHKLFEDMDKELEQGGMQTQTVLDMTGLYDSKRAYETAMHEARADLKTVWDSCTKLTKLSGEQLKQKLDQCLGDSGDFKQTYPDIMHEFLGTLSADLQDNVKDKPELQELQNYINAKVPKVMQQVGEMCSEVRVSILFIHSVPFPFPSGAKSISGDSEWLVQV